ncbi:MAG: 30S ribosomal protein S6 [Flavobacteriaceae bacterium]|nr:30S ribosomal protein S6 [Flavobacteriaceae bacterium]
MERNYETVFILNPVLSEDQIKETVKKFEDFLVKEKAEIVAKEDWGLKKMAYTIQKKKSGFYHLIEFKANPNTDTESGLDLITKLETEFRRDDRVMRNSVIKLDGPALAWSVKRRNNSKTAKK